jgi:hypothetical protein
MPHAICDNSPAPAVSRQSAGQFENSSAFRLQMLPTQRKMSARNRPSGKTVVGDTAMSKPVYYVQECPTCGRRLQIRVSYLGKRVVCQHCMAEFAAADPAGAPAAPASESSSSLLLRADELLATVNRQHGFA